ncbi:iron ABC transporter permease [Schumannella sp. 10F1B-5-1]|uniref:iron ABC transporter permease n=1 Tax=Schumannella sp. 10F1B-5-1 TaxID=2590780 RepID=UPI0011304C9D|nr:iron ABC transporter permease [Schumannella sp. 10F1B-5-1]TPW78455.1 iron ABC transporter permease [Schumannella sp. 10F1B-5-1]
MTLASTTSAAAPGATPGAGPSPDLAPTGGSRRLPLFFALGLVLLVVLALADLTQGTASVGPAELWAVITGETRGAGSGGVDAAAVLLASRLPRLVAALIVGVALGLAGCALQSISRNPLAAPDTLAVNAGAQLAVTVTAVSGIALPVLPSGALAFAGGLIAAVVVLGLAGGGSPLRLVLAGSAVGLGLSAASTALMLLFSVESRGLFAWTHGHLTQTRIDGLAQMAPVLIVVAIALLAMSRKLDLLGLGDDGAATVGADPRRIRVTGVVLAVALSAIAVAVAGPVGFVGLAAPAIARMSARRIPGLARHRALLPASALLGMIVVVGADVVVRLVLGAQAGIEVPTGVVTTIFGAIFVVALALRLRGTGLVAAGDALARRRSVGVRVAVVVTLLALLVAAVIAGSLLGDAKLLLGDVTNWILGQAGPRVQFVLDTRMPRVGAALLAGAALALAGAIIQAVTRNALAEPSLLGVSGGGGLAAVLVITAVPLADPWLITLAAAAGSIAVATLVFLLALRGGLRQDRLVMIGIGVSSAVLALIQVVLVLTDPYNQVKALTWLSGSTYAREAVSLLPLALLLLVAIPVLAAQRRELDLVALDDDAPRTLGLRLGGTRLLLLGVAVLLTAGAVASIGVIGFVGLIAPHAARALVGSRHSRMLPVAALLGALIVLVADTIGRTVIAPEQLPAGIMTAVVGTPYFLYLLVATRKAR